MSAGGLDAEALLKAAADAGTDSNVITFMQTMVNEVRDLKMVNAELSNSNQDLQFGYEDN